MTQRRLFPFLLGGAGGTALTTSTPQRRLFPMLFGSSGAGATTYTPQRRLFPMLFGTSGAATAPTTDTNSGVQRLRAFHGDQDHYREVQRREALQVQQIRLAELQQQQREIEAKRIADEALRKAAQTQGPKAKVAQPDSGFDDRIASLTGELAALNGAIVDTRVEIARLDAIEVYEALQAEQAIDDETILILAASI